MISTVGYSVEEVINDYNNGYCVAEIANKYATTSKVIRKLLKDNGVDIKKSSSKETDDNFIQYVVSEFKDGKTVKYISSDSETSDKLIRKILKKNKLNADVVKTAEESESLVREDYASIKKLIDKGYSMEQIAEMYSLNNQKAIRVYKQALTSKSVSEPKSKKKEKSGDKKSRSIPKEEEEKIKKLLSEGRSKRSISIELNRSYNVITRIEKELKSDKISSVSKKNKPEDVMENHNPCFKSYEEKKKYLDKLYGRGNWKILTREEFRRLLKIKTSEEQDSDVPRNMSAIEASKFDAYKDMFFDI